jgi:hypothetical protein
MTQMPWTQVPSLIKLQLKQKNRNTKIKAAASNVPREAIWLETALIENLVTLTVPERQTCLI